MTPRRWHQKRRLRGSRGARKDKEEQALLPSPVAVMHDRPSAQRKEKRASALLPQIASRHLIRCLPKAWSLGSPVLIGQTVCIAENIEEEMSNKEKTNEVNIGNAQLADAKLAIKTKNFEREIAKHKDLLDKAKLKS